MTFDIDFPTKIEQLKPRTKIQVPRFRLIYGPSMGDRIARIREVLKVWSGGDNIDKEIVVAVDVIWDSGADEILFENIRQIKVLNKPVYHTISHTANNELKVGDKVSWYGTEDEIGIVKKLSYVVYEDVAKEKYGVKILWDNRIEWVYLETDKLFDHALILNP